MTLQTGISFFKMPVWTSCKSFLFLYFETQKQVMNISTQLREFLKIPLSTSTPSTTALIPAHPNPSTSFDIEPPHKYDPMFNDVFLPEEVEFGEFPDLQIDEVYGNVIPGKRVQIKKEKMLDHRAIYQVFFILHPTHFPIFIFVAGLYQILLLTELCKWYFSCTDFKVQGILLCTK